MATKPYSIFNTTIIRAENLIELHDTEVDLDEKDDQLRAAVIIAIAAFDRYFTAKFCDVLVDHLKSKKAIGDSLFERIEKAGFDTKFALSLISETVENRSSRPFRKIRTIVQNSLSTHTTHRESVIDELFLSLGLKDLCENAVKKARRARALKDVDQLVELRHEIAHEAHVKQDGKPRRIERAKIERQVENLKIFVSSCDEIINSKFNK